MKLYCLWQAVADACSVNADAVKKNEFTVQYEQIRNVYHQYVGWLAASCAFYTKNPSSMSVFLHNRGHRLLKAAGHGPKVNTCTAISLAAATLSFNSELDESIDCARTNDVSHRTEYQFSIDTIA